MTAIVFVLIGIMICLSLNRIADAINQHTKAVIAIEMGKMGVKTDG